MPHYWNIYFVILLLGCFIKCDGHVYKTATMSFEVLSIGFDSVISMYGEVSENSNIVAFLLWWWFVFIPFFCMGKIIILVYLLIQVFLCPIIKFIWGYCRGTRYEIVNSYFSVCTTKNLLDSEKDLS